jgi:hypothetical protein
MQQFEKQKNIKAGTITGIICGAMLFLFFIISWTIPPPDVQTQEEGIEVNLGNSDIGSGEIQPLIPDPPAAEEEQVNTPPKTQQTQPEEAKEVETNDNDKEAPNVSLPKPIKSTPNNPNIPKKENTAPVKNTNPKPTVVENPKPAPPQPKYIYKGGDGTGKGGNNADGWNNSQGQGVAGGKGDQGKINGNPNSDSYTGNGGSGKSGVSISKGLQGRRITRLPSFEDEFNENAKVAVDIKVDKSGSVLSATFQPRGSTTSDGGMREIALRKARLLKFSANPDGSDMELGTIIFNFRLKN